MLLLLLTKFMVVVLSLSVGQLLVELGDLTLTEAKAFEVINGGPSSFFRRITHTTVNENSNAALYDPETRATRGFP